MIEVKDLTFAYSYGEAFNVSSGIYEEGKLTSVIGKNGSGKSTFLRVLAGLKPYKGSVLIDGEECRSYASMERAKKVAFLPQIIGSANMNVKTLVEHGRYPYHGNLRRMSEEDYKQIGRALDITQMTSYAERELKELSGGERQRAYLAMVIAQDSAMILLDEPTTYMDYLHQKLFYEILDSLKTEGKGIVMVCHDLEQSFAYSDRICLMSDRKMARTGSPQEFISDEELLKSNFGVSIKANEDPEALYPYILKK